MHQKHEYWRSWRTPEAWEAAEARSRPSAAAVERIRCDRRHIARLFFPVASWRPHVAPVLNSDRKKVYVYPTQAGRRPV